MLHLEEEEEEESESESVLCEDEEKRTREKWVELWVGPRDDASGRNKVGLEVSYYIIEAI